jgi:hypothetical protein
MKGYNDWAFCMLVNPFQNARKMFLGQPLGKFSSSILSTQSPRGLSRHLLQQGQGSKQFAQLGLGFMSIFILYYLVLSATLGYLYRRRTSVFPVIK